ncbi:hypothetical protein ABT215_04055 [Streptomyces sp900105755]|uniref:hypothetical protein n=1 Tax=Streptomyces sp. 900105755 TaxID=3154389 RepID=UPI00331992BA
MTETARRFPTPGDVAARRIPPSPAAPSFDRDRWERALLAAPLPHHNARLLGWALAHLAPRSGKFPAGGPHGAERLSAFTNMTRKQLGISLAQLQEAGLIHRPDRRTWQAKDTTRPITLTLPSAALRTEPAHTGGADR